MKILGEKYDYSFGKFLGLGEETKTEIVKIYKINSKFVTTRCSKEYFGILCQIEDKSRFAAAF